MKRWLISSVMALYFAACLGFAKEKTVKIIAAGDTAICEIYQRSIKTNHRWLIDILEDIEKKDGLEKAIDYPFKNVKSCFEDGIAFCNLEGAYASTGNTQSQRADKTFTIFMPEKYFDSLKIFDIVSLANNHAMDYKNTGIYNTTWELKKRGIQYIGAGKNLDSARRPKIVEHSGIKVGFLAYSMIGPDYFYATEQTPGVAGNVKEKSLEYYLREDIPKLKRDVDAVVVSFHWGEEGSQTSNDQQRKFGHLAIDSGASLIIGHHPHCLQESEQYKKGLIAYSLGNFVFGGGYHKGNRYTAILRAQINEDGEVVSYDFIPLRIDPKTTKYQPQVIKKEEAEKIFRILKFNKQ